MSVQQSSGGQRRVLDSLPVHAASEPGPGPYRLQVEGLVSQPRELQSHDLEAMPQQVLVDDFGCLEGWTVPGLRWRGVALSTLLDLVAVRPEATWVQVTSGDFSVPLPIDQARTALVALELNGEPLPHAHGGPARLVLPGGECFTSIKWIDHIEVRDQPGDNSARRVALGRLGGSAT